MRSRGSQRPASYAGRPPQRVLRLHALHHSAHTASCRSMRDTTTAQAGCIHVEQQAQQTAHRLRRCGSVEQQGGISPCRGPVCSGSLTGFIRSGATPGATTLTLGTASKEQAQRPGTPALGRSAAPTWGPWWLPQHCGSHARTVVQCAHSGGVGLGTRPLVRSQRTVRRYSDPPPDLC